MAQGSLEESRYYIILSKDLGYIDNSMYVELESLVEKTSWFLNAYCKGIVNDNALKQQ
ncbi:four helix bundle protein [uncultured Prevotella sp.]|uniref:four helix bundle protein n=1 Tax=uncultured Prevotella sp. TaxID=159272 RepID=UPI0027E385D5|nr:four helix bundle protein [uncultured Prevotella sp.]